MRLVYIKTITEQIIELLRYSEKPISDIDHIELTENEFRRMILDKLDTKL